MEKINSKRQGDILILILKVFMTAMAILKLWMTRKKRPHWLVLWEKARRPLSWNILLWLISLFGWSLPISGMREGFPRRYTTECTYHIIQLAVQHLIVPCYMCSYNPNLKHCPYSVQSSHHQTTMLQLPGGSLFKAAQHRQSVAFYEACRRESLSETALGHHDFRNYYFFSAN